jgi:uncharacterized protein YqeY
VAEGIGAASGDAARALSPLYNVHPSAYAARVALSEEQLAQDLARAMKAREMQRVYVLRGLIAAAKLLKVEKKGASLAEADLVQVVRREIRKREEAEEFAAKAGRDDVVAQNRAERQLLAAYAPPELPPEELESTIRSLVADPATRSLGAVMGVLRSRYAGRFDGKAASELARRLLAEVGQGA